MSNLSLLSEYQDKLLQYERQRGELNQESKFYAEYRDFLKQQMKSFGVNTTEELKKLHQDAVFILSNSYQTQRDYEEAFKNYIEITSQIKTIREEFKKISSELTSEETNIALYKQTLSFLSDLSDAIRGNQTAYIEGLVTTALNKILEPKKFKFRIISKESTMPAIDFIVEDEDGALDSSDLLKANGGGIVDILSVVLRLILLELEQPKNSAPVLLDEVGKFLSDDYQERFGEFLKEWSKTFNRQIFLVTHKPGVVKYADKVFRISKENGRSTVEEK